MGRASQLKECCMEKRHCLSIHSSPLFCVSSINLLLFFYFWSGPRLNIQRRAYRQECVCSIPHRYGNERIVNRWQAWSDLMQKAKNHALPTNVHLVVVNIQKASYVSQNSSENAVCDFPPPLSTTDYGSRHDKVPFPCSKVISRVLSNCEPQYFPLYPTSNNQRHNEIEGMMMTIPFPSPTKVQCTDTNPVAANMLFGYSPSL
jgi:hypothetical protein